MKTKTLLISLAFTASAACTGCSSQPKTSGNPVFEGKYANPEYAIFRRVMESGNTQKGRPHWNSCMTQAKEPARLPLDKDANVIVRYVLF